MIYVALPAVLESKRSVLSRHFNLENPSPPQIARLDTLAIYELAGQYGLTKDILLFGGQAFNTYFQTSRDTVDIDLALNSGKPKGIFAELGYVNAHTRNSELKKESYKRKVGNAEVELDVFIPGKTVLGGDVLVDQEMFDRSLTMNYLDIPMNLCNAVDFVATKIGAGRAKDYQDVIRTILGKADEFDKKYAQRRLGKKKEHLLEAPEHVASTLSHMDAIKYKKAVEELLG